MTKGIRAFTIERFNAALPQLNELGAVAFRREVMAQTVIAFEITVASAATHYNHALKLARATNPEAVATLGRAEDKKGGRKPVHTVDVIRVKTGELVAGGLSKSKAELLISRAKASRKPALAIREAAEAAAVVAAAEPALV